MPTLKQYGFLEAGEWQPHPNIQSGITFDVPNSIFAKERVIFAFMVEGIVKYIGVCDVSNTSLVDRMKRYKYLSGTGANARIAEKIKHCLDEQKVVKILVLKPKGSPKYCGLTVDLVNGLKAPLIHRFRPEWNKFH